MTHLSIPHDAWVLVGDGEKALVLRNEGDEVYPNLVVHRAFANQNPATREQGSDQPGRLNDSQGNKSAIEPTDWHRLEKERFAREVAGALYRLAHADEFEKLVVVAPPLVLGKLRETLHPEVRSRVIAEIDKTLTHHPVHEIERLITRPH